MMENEIGNETETCTLKGHTGIYRDSTPIMENPLEKKMEHEMETGGILGSKEPESSYHNGYWVHKRV